MFRTSQLAVLIVILAVLPSTVSAQVAVQLPVIEQFGVQTVVSVPDGGAILLGSLSRGSESGSSAGPLGTSTGTGRSHDHQSMWTSVHIHDFEALDAAVLAKARQIRQQRRMAMTRQAEHTILSSRDGVDRRSQAPVITPELRVKAAAARMALSNP